MQLDRAAQFSNFYDETVQRVPFKYSIISYTPPTSYIDMS